MGSDIIVAARGAAENLRDLQIDQLVPRAGSLESLGSGYYIRNVSCANARQSAGSLLNRMYARRGYVSSGLSGSPTADTITLSAGDTATTRGTLSVGFDGASGLLVDECFPEETHRLRAEGRRLCEFKKLAVDSGPQSKQVLASLFHVAYAAARLVRGCDNILIEINPRHVGYYRRMLGFEVLGSERPNPRVDAPALLLCLDLGHAQTQIAQFGGRPDLAGGQRSLYPYFMSAAEERGVVQRLRGATARPPARPLPARRHAPVAPLRSFAAAALRR